MLGVTIAQKLRQQPHSSIGSEFQLRGDTDAIANKKLKVNSFENLQFSSQPSGQALL
jgi:hypothetical protein